MSASPANTILAAEHGAAVLIVHVPEVTLGAEPYSPMTAYAASPWAQRAATGGLERARGRLRDLDVAVSTRIVDGETSIAELVAGTAEQ